MRNKLKEVLMFETQEMVNVYLLIARVYNVIDT